MHESTRNAAPSLPAPLIVHPSAPQPRTSSSSPSDADGPETILPVSIRSSTATPTAARPPDVWIHRANPRTEYINVHPPHAPSVPVPVPATPNIVATGLQDGRDGRDGRELRDGRQTNPPDAAPTYPPAHHPDPFPPVRSRDYAYKPPIYAPVQQQQYRAPLQSVPSHTSTQMSQLDIVAAPSRRPAVSFRHGQDLYGRPRSGSQPEPRAVMRTDMHIPQPGGESLVEQWRADPDVISTATPVRSQPPPLVSAAPVFFFDMDVC